MIEINSSQRFKLYFQRTFGSIGNIIGFTLVLYVFYVLYITLFSHIEYNYLIFIIAVPIIILFVIVMFIIFRINTLCYLLKKDLYISEGKIIKAHYDNYLKHDERYLSHQKYDEKKLSLFSDKVIVKRVYNGSVRRAKAQTLDEKHTTPWVVVPKTVVKNKDSYKVYIVFYHKEAITFLYTK